MSVRYIHPIRVTALLILAAGLLAACSAIQPVNTAPDIAQSSSAPLPSASSVVSTAPSASIAASPAAAAPDASTAAAIDEQAVMAGIQATLDRYSQAYNENDPTLLAQTIDQSNAPFRRLVQGKFQATQESVFGGGGGYDYRVTRIKPRQYGFIEAHIELWGSAHDWTFREVDGRWLLSEPTEKQIGARQKTETEHFTYYTYHWSDDINSKVIELMEQAYTEVRERLGKAPEKKADIYIKPIFGGPPLTDPQTLAFYWSASHPRGADRMVIFAPGSFAFGFYDASNGWEPKLQTALTHEYVHLVNNRSFTPIHRMSDWMFEGLAEYVADNPRASEVSAAVRSDNIIPIIDPSDRVNKQDLQRLTILERDESLAYGLSYSLVAFVVEKYGGLDGFWKLVQVYDQKQKLPESLQEAFGVSYEQFDQEWRAWLKENY